MPNYTIRAFAHIPDFLLHVRCSLGLNVDQNPYEHPARTAARTGPTDVSNLRHFRQAICADGLNNGWLGYAETCADKGDISDKLIDTVFSIIGQCGPQSLEYNSRAVAPLAGEITHIALDHIGQFGVIQSV